MIYLLRLIKPGQVFWKIGYAADVNKRFLQYEYYCPGIELVSTKPGERLEESLYHKYFHSFPQFFIGYHKDEWYITSEIFGSFIQRAFEDVPVENMKDVVWENRDKALSKYSQGDKEIWDSLRRNYESLTSSDTDRQMSKAKEDPLIDLMLKDDSEEIREFAGLFKKERRFDLKLRLYCEFRENYKNNQAVSTKVEEYLKGFPFETYYSYFGLVGCRAQGFRLDRLKRLLSDKLNKDTIRSGVHQKFVLKKKYSLRTIKKILKDLYLELSINRTAKASDILEYFVVKEVSRIDPNTGKRVRGYELISIK